MLRAVWEVAGYRRSVRLKALLPLWLPWIQQRYHLSAAQPDCRLRHIQFTRGRPHKKDDNAPIEQKNWTHVRKLPGWERYDSAAAIRFIQTLYRGDLRLMMNLFQPSVKLVKTVRIGSRLIRRYDRPQTPLDRLVACGASDPQRVQALRALRHPLDPFAIAQSIERQLDHIWSLANDRRSPRPAPALDFRPFDRR